MNMPMSQAQAILAGAEADLTSVRQQLAAVGSGPCREARHKVAAVLRGGYELARINEVLGRLEELESELHRSISRTGGVIEAIRSVREG